MACRETSFVPLPLVVVVELSYLRVDEYVFPFPRTSVTPSANQ